MKGINLNYRYLVDIDKNFDKRSFEEYAKDVFLKLQYAWTNDYEEDSWNDNVRQYMTDDVFNLYDKQLNRLRDKHQINVVKRIRCSASILAYKEIENYDLLAVRIKGKLRDHIKCALTGKKIMGDKTEDIEIEYTYIYIRPITARDPENLKSTQCAYCGSEINPGANNRCEYCEGINITTNSPNWILCKVHHGIPDELYDIKPYIDTELEEEDCESDKDIDTELENGGIIYE